MRLKTRQFEKPSVRGKPEGLSTQRGDDITKYNRFRPKKQQKNTRTLPKAVRKEIKY